jgi:hypothetical protein
MGAQRTIGRRNVLAAVSGGVLASAGLAACTKDSKSPATTGARSGHFPLYLIAPDPNPKGYGLPEIANFLSSIYGPGPSGTSPGNQFACYFNLQSFRWNDYIDQSGVHVRDGYAAAAGAALGASKSKGLKIAQPNPPLYPWKQINDPANCVLSLQVMDTLAGAASFAPTPPRGDANVLKRVFVQLDSLGVVVPWDTAMLLSACFIKGFVTRYILGKYVPTWVAAIPSHPKLPIAFEDVATQTPRPPNPTPILAYQAVDSWIKGTKTTLGAKLADVSTWNVDYSQVLKANTDVSVQMLGILTGWRAVDALEALAAGGNTDASYVESQIWKLIGVRYNTLRLGSMVGYVLMVLTGFLKSGRSTAVFNTKPSDPVPILPSDNTSVLVSLTDDVIQHRGSKRDDIQHLIVRMQNLLIGELYSISVNPQYNPPNGITAEVAAAHQSGFITGFARGMTEAADQLFFEFYRDGYYKGYKEGYELGNQVGYSAGFTDGYTQGYAGGYQVGYTDGTPSSQSFLGGLGQIVAGIGSAANNIQDLLGATAQAGTVIATIAALF